LLRSALPAILLAVPILFAPEIRRALEQIGRAGALLPRTPNVSTSQRVAEIVAAAAQQMSERRWGALIVIERGTALGEYVQRGTVIDGSLSVELLLNIFYPNSPLHDGAVIVHAERIVAAGVVLPLAQSASVEHVGTRHRAAIGITEGTDAVAVVVSEETGRVSLANAGRMVRNLTQPRLIKVLTILEQRPSAGIPTLVPPKGPPDEQTGFAVG
jgi:diadenylate cyclase